MLTKQLSRQGKAWQDYRKYLARSKFIRPAAHFRVIFEINTMLDLFKKL